MLTHLKDMKNPISNSGKIQYGSSLKIFQNLWGDQLHKVWKSPQLELPDKICHTVKFESQINNNNFVALLYLKYHGTYLYKSYTIFILYSNLIRHLVVLFAKSGNLTPMTLQFSPPGSIHCS